MKTRESTHCSNRDLWPFLLQLQTHTHAHWCILPNCVLYHLRKLVAIFLAGAWRKRECKWVQTAGAFLVARSDGGPGGLTHQPLVLPPPFRQKPTGEKVGRLLQQRDQMVRKVKSTAHSVSMMLLVTWVMLLMPSWPTGVQRVRTAPQPNWHHVWAWDEVLPVNLAHGYVFRTFEHSDCCHLLYLFHKLLYLHTNQYSVSTNSYYYSNTKIQDWQIM